MVWQWSSKYTDWAGKHVAMCNHWLGTAAMAYIAYMYIMAMA